VYIAWDGGGDHRLCVYDAETFAEVRATALPPHTIAAIAVSTDGDRVYVGVDQDCFVFDATTLEVRRILRGHTDIVCTIAVSADFVYTGSCDARLRIWSVHTDALVREVVPDCGEVHRATLSSNFLYVVPWFPSDCYAWEKDGTAIAWTLEHGSNVRDVAILRDRVYTLDEDGFCHIWCEATRRPLRTVEFGGDLFGILVSETHLYASGLHYEGACSALDVVACGGTPWTFPTPPNDTTYGVTACSSSGRIITGTARGVSMYRPATADDRNISVDERDGVYVITSIGVLVPPERLVRATALLMAVNRVVSGRGGGGALTKVIAELPAVLLLMTLRSATRA
jgi:WD40 repeat protein